MYQLSKEVFNVYGWKIQYVREQKRLAAEAGLDIYKSALERLYGDGFRIEQAGSMYMAKLIECLYHERELLNKYYRRLSYQGYWDLKDIYNPHYYQLGDSNEVQEEIRKSIIDSSCEKDDADLNELIYDLSDREIIQYNYLYKDDMEHAAKNAISYKKLLPDYYKH